MTCWHLQGRSIKLWVMLAKVPQFVRLERTLDKHTLAIVEINRESRIKVKLDSSMPDAQQRHAGVT